MEEAVAYVDGFVLLDGEHLITMPMKPACFSNCCQIDQWLCPKILAKNKAAIFAEWINSVNVQMRKEKRWVLIFREGKTSDKFLALFNFREILLFLGNAPVYPVDLKQSDLTIIFFPSLHDQRRAFKAHYGNQLVKRIFIRCTLASTPDQVVVTALDAVAGIAAAWNDVTQSTMVNRFGKASFRIQWVGWTRRDCVYSRGTTIVRRSNWNDPKMTSACFCTSTGVALADSSTDAETSKQSSITDCFRRVWL